MCTNLSIERKSEKSPVISARTMDFTIEIPTVINFVPRRQSFPEFPLHEEIEWENKYGFIGTLHSFLKESGYSDGLNEAGLSAAALWLECTKYPKPDSGCPILSTHNVVSYILGNFKNIEEVKEALSKVTIVDVGRPVRIPIHLIVSDALGNHLIVEYINGEMKTYTNTMGVLTNDPPYDWHLTNLCNYKNLSLENSPNYCPKVQLYGTGQFGSPGDPTSPSRFIRAELLRRSMFRPRNTRERIGLAHQILGTLSEPCGTVMLGDKPGFDWTQWGLIRDHTNRSIYFYTAFNSKLYGIHLNKLDLNAPKQKQISIRRLNWYVDFTGRFK